MNAEDRSLMTNKCLQTGALPHHLSLLSFCLNEPGTSSRVRKDCRARWRRLASRGPSTSHRAHARHPAATLVPHLLRIAVLARPPTPPIVIQRAVRIVATPAIRAQKPRRGCESPPHPLYMLAARHLVRPGIVAPSACASLTTFVLDFKDGDALGAGDRDGPVYHGEAKIRDGGRAYSMYQSTVRNGLPLTSHGGEIFPSSLCAREIRLPSHLPPWLILYPAPSVVLGSLKFLLALHTDGRHHALPRFALSTAGAEYLDPGRYHPPSSIHAAFLYITLVSPSTLATVA
ncbi:hypothetical protein B0H19DRAFT_1379109 [Mycena capillaripes]|nr:hypothetical protein B0H19DRAFT_1379109 [Mycena capillaripes]